MVKLDIVLLVEEVYSLLFRSYSARKKDGNLKVVIGSKTSKHNLGDLVE